MRAALLSVGLAFAAPGLLTVPRPPVWVDWRLAVLANVLVEMPWATHAPEFNLSSPSGQLTACAVGWFPAAVCR